MKVYVVLDNWCEYKEDQYEDRIIGIFPTFKMAKDAVLNKLTVFYAEEDNIIFTDVDSKVTKVTYNDESGDYYILERELDDSEPKQSNKKGSNKVIIIGGILAAMAIGGIAGYLSNGKKRAIERDCYAVYGDLMVKDVDVTDFVKKHLRFIDRFDPYAVTNAVLWTHGIYEGFGGDEKLPVDGWKFFTRHKEV